jgi:hypothetical protein
LAVICGQAQLLLQKNDLPEEIRNKTKIIYDMGIRISEIIKQLDQVQDKTREYVRGEKMIDIQSPKKRSSNS